MEEQRSSEGLEVADGVRAGRAVPDRVADLPGELAGDRGADLVPERDYVSLFGVSAEALEELRTAREAAAAGRVTIQRWRALWGEVLAAQGDVPDAGDLRQLGAVAGERLVDLIGRTTAVPGPSTPGEGDDAGDGSGDADAQPAADAEAGGQADGAGELEFWERLTDDVELLLGPPSDEDLVAELVRWGRRLENLYEGTGPVARLSAEVRASMVDDVRERWLRCRRWAGEADLVEPLEERSGLPVELVEMCRVAGMVSYPVLGPVPVGLRQARVLAWDVASAEQRLVSRHALGFLTFARHSDLNGALASAGLAREVIASFVARAFERDDAGSRQLADLWASGALEDLTRDVLDR